MIKAFTNFIMLGIVAILATLLVVSFLKPSLLSDLAEMVKEDLTLAKQTQFLKDNGYNIAVSSEV